MQRAYKRIFGELHEVVHAQDGAHALEILSERQDFDVIFCDLDMPGVTGVEAYQRLRERSRELSERIVFVTGGAAEEKVVSFLESVDNAVIHKPFDFDALRQLVRERAGAGSVPATAQAGPDR